MKILPILVATLLACGSLAYADKAVSDLVKRANSRDVAAMRTLGMRLFNGAPGIPVQRGNALKWLNMAAEKDDVPSILFLADLYANGTHVSKSEKKAAELYLRADKLGSDKAAAKIAKLPVKYVEDWHERHARDGNYASALKLAEYYEAGEQAGSDTERARKYYKLAIESNRAKALKRMEKKKLPKGLLFWTVLAEEMKDEAAAMRLADAYSSGLGVPRDAKKGAKFYCIAASAGNETAREIVKSLPMADTIPWWRDRSEKGDADAAIKLVEAFETGDGVEKNQELAFEALDALMHSNKKAAEEFLATRSLARQEPYLRHRAKNRDDVDAMITLARAYEAGSGVSQSNAKAMEMYCLAAACGNSTALDKVKSRPVGEVLVWWERRAMAGETAAALRLGECYDKGLEGVPRNSARAATYYKMAADAGEEKAVAWMKEYNPGYKTPAEAAEANMGVMTRALQRLGITSPRFLTISGGRLSEKKVPLTEFADLETYAEYVLNMPVFQKVSSNRYFCRRNDQIICVEVPDHVNVTFADGEVVRGILVRNGEYTYENLAGYVRVIPQYVLVLGLN